MHRLSTVLPLLLASLCLASCGAPAPSAQAAAPASTSNANSATATCAEDPNTRPTSKVRHVPNEDDPCGKSHGLAQPVSQP